MSALTRFYQAVFGLPEDWDGSTEDVARKDARTAGLIFSFEMVRGEEAS
jgi:hypothetical protein